MSQCEPAIERFHFIFLQISHKICVYSIFNYEVFSTEVISKGQSIVIFFANTLAVNNHCRLFHMDKNGIL